MIYDRLTVDTDKISIDLQFKTRLTIVSGKSGSGRTFIAKAIMEYSKNHDSYKHISYINSNHDTAGRNILEFLQSVKDRFIIIDNADVLLDEKTRAHIVFDKNNQYMLYCRNFEDLVYSSKQLAVITQKKEDKIKFTLTYPINGPYW